MKRLLPIGLCLLAIPLLAPGCTGGRPVGEAAIEAEPFSGDALNFIVLGDWGRAGFFNQREVAAQMGRTAEAIRSRFVISTGDNFYTTGVASTEDVKWLRSFEEIYTARSLWEPWYVTLGNHDWQGNPYAQVAYTQISPRWRMPAPYFATRFRLDDDSTDVLFVFLDTTPLGDFERAEIYPMSDTWNQREQLRWLDSTLAASDAEWKVAVGHHPIVVGSRRYRDNPHLLRDVLPILERHGVQAYFAGHEHNLQHLRLPGRSMEHFVSGAGSLLRDPLPDENTRWALRTSGFMTVSLTPETMFVQAIDVVGRVVYAVSVARTVGPSGPGTPATREAFDPGEPVPAEGEGPPTEVPPAREDDDTTPIPTGATPEAGQSGGRRP